MDNFAGLLQAIGYHAVLIQPLLPMNLHLILSALFPIYTGAHASLSRPSSAAKPPKRKKKNDGEEEDDEPEEPEQKMEGMAPSDAIMLPLLAGTTLASLYYLIKWLEDPAILNKVLNWYFSVFGVLALARLMTDVTGTVMSFVFPNVYTLKRRVCNVHSKERRAISNSSPPETRDSPLPGRLATLPIPGVLKSLLWKVRELPSQKFRIRLFIRKVLSANLKIGPQGLFCFFLAVAAQIYFNLIAKPWWLTNALGFSLAYNALQLISPTTSWTGTMILGALFIYDIYFVFFTPLMVTVATKLDIPAKLLFPRPSGPGDDPEKQAMSMLGLGDIVLPGMMIGFALRFDLYLYYLRKQMCKETEDATERQKAGNVKPSDGKVEDHTMEKDTWYTATGGWGEKFWSSRKAIITSEQYHGTIFPKPYFHATLIGYVMGMLSTLGVMQVFGHAQPALLYLVPGVLGALWGTALIRGEVRLLWAYSEMDEEEEKKERKSKENTSKSGDDTNARKWHNWKSMFFSTLKKKQIPDPTPENKDKDYAAADGEAKDSGQSEINQSASEPKADTPKNESKSHSSSHSNRHRNELVFFSISLPSVKSVSSETHDE